MLETSPENWTSRCSTTLEGTRPSVEMQEESSFTSSIESCSQIEAP